MEEDKLTKKERKRLIRIGMTSSYNCLVPLVVFDEDKFVLDCLSIIERCTQFNCAKMTMCNQIDFATSEEVGGEKINSESESESEGNWPDDPFISFSICLCIQQATCD